MIIREGMKLQLKKYDNSFRHQAPNAVEQMHKHFGKIVTVHHEFVHTDTKGKTWFFINEDNAEWKYTMDWVEKQHLDVPKLPEDLFRL